MRKTTDLFKTLSDPSRLRILKMLQVRDLCVCEITAALSLSAPTVSKHLHILRNADLIWDRKDGKWVNYGLNKQAADPLLTNIQRLIKEINEDDPVFRKDRDIITSTSREIICGINPGKESRMAKILILCTGEKWDYVITVCDHARETCPVFSGDVGQQLHIGFEDPAEATGSEEEVLEIFRLIRDEIKRDFFRFYTNYLKQN